MSPWFVVFFCWRKMSISKIHMLCHVIKSKWSWVLPFQCLLFLWTWLLLFFQHCCEVWQKFGRLYLGSKKCRGGSWPESCGSEIVRHLFVCFLNETLCKRWDILHINRFVRMFFNSCSNFKWSKMMEFIVYGCLWHCFLPKMTSFFVDFCMSSNLPNLQSDFGRKISNWSCSSLVEYSMLRCNGIQWVTYNAIC